MTDTLYELIIWNGNGSYTPKCECGWSGKDRWTYSEAVAVVRSHLKSKRHNAGTDSSRQ